MSIPLLLVSILVLSSASPLTPEENKNLQESCGKIDGPRDKRSTNGIRTDEILAPWVAAIGLGPHDIYCTAVWISPRHVLTAAHCLNFVYKLGSKTFFPYVINTKNTKSGDQYEALEAFLIEKVHHPWLYLPINPTTFGDIALAEVAMDDSKTISKPICLPKKDVIFGGNITMYGYGIDVNDTSTQHLGVLRSITSKTVFCPFHGVFSICFNGFPQLACHGDSGGPLVTKSEDERSVANGIMATINHICKQELWNDVIGYMNTGTNIFYHLDWICHASGVCPNEDISNFVKNFGDLVRTKYRTYNTSDLPQYNI